MITPGPASPIRSHVAPACPRRSAGTRGSRLEQDDAERVIEGREGERVGIRVELRHVGVIDEAAELDVLQAESSANRLSRSDSGPDPAMTSLIRGCPPRTRAAATNSRSTPLCGTRRPAVRTVNLTGRS